MEKNTLISRNKVEIEKILCELFTSNDSVFTKKIEYGDCKITVFIVEDYYLRINSNLTLTVIVEETADKTTAEIISSGGKVGLGGLSYGAEKRAAKSIVKLLKENGFTEQ